MVFDKFETDRKIRAIALELLPEFDASYWHSWPTEREVIVRGWLKLPNELSYGFYKFVINGDHGISYRGDLELNNDKRGKGYGKRLVEMREKISLELGAYLVVISHNDNPSFWKHLHYDPLPKTFEGFLTKNFRDVHCIRPAYKLLSEA